MRESLPTKDPESFSDPVLEKRVNDLMEIWMQKCVEDARELFNKKMLILGEAPQDTSVRREQYCAEVREKNRIYIRKHGRMVWLTNNFFGHFPGGMSRNDCDQLHSMFSTEVIHMCGKPYREFYQDFDDVLAELNIEPEQYATIAQSMSEVNTDPELVARVWIALIDRGYKQEDLWA